MFLFCVFILCFYFVLLFGFERALSADIHITVRTLQTWRNARYVVHVHRFWFRGLGQGGSDDICGNCGGNIRHGVVV